MNALPIPRLALTATEAPEALGVSDDFFREHVASELRWVRRGRKKLVSVTELQHWLEQSAARTLEEPQPRSHLTPESASPALGGAKGSRDNGNAQATD